MRQPRAVAGCAAPTSVDTRNLPLFPSTLARRSGEERPAYIANSISVSGPLRWLPDRATRDLYRQHRGWVDRPAVLVGQQPLVGSTGDDCRPCSGGPPRGDTHLLWSLGGAGCPVVADRHRSRVVTAFFTWYCYRMRHRGILR